MFRKIWKKRNNSVVHALSQEQHNGPCARFSPRILESILLLSQLQSQCRWASQLANPNLHGDTFAENTPKSLRNRPCSLRHCGWTANLSTKTAPVDSGIDSPRHRPATDARPKSRGSAFFILSSCGTNCSVASASTFPPAGQDRRLSLQIQIQTSAQQASPAINERCSQQRHRFFINVPLSIQAFKQPTTGQMHCTNNSPNKTPFLKAVQNSIGTLVVSKSSSRS